MTDILELRKELEQIKTDAASKIRRAAAIEKELAEEESRIAQAADFLTDKLGSAIEKDRFLDFFKKPYVVIPQGQTKALVAVPKFVRGFQVGWLWKETDSFYIYQFDQYSAWLGDAPNELLDQINLRKSLDVTIEGNTLTFDSQQRSAVREKLGRHLRELGETHATISKGHVFDVIADTIKSGCLPFRPMPVAAEDLREPRSSIKLYPYQQAAVDKFLKTGAVGVFYPTGAGKSFITLYLIDILKGAKLIVVPSKTLVEQWQHYVDTYVPHAKDEVRISTYQGYRPSDNQVQYTLFVPDECHRLPADTFSRLALIPTKYRLGLSASPHREDGRESYIFALTGFPIGLNWRDYMETVKKSYHPVYVHVVRSMPDKLRRLASLVDAKKKTLVFCDSIDLGKRAAAELSAPYIYGDSENRLETIRANRVVVASRVADMGVSIKGLQRIIEIDFLFGSRQQELQRTGRLMHSDDAERHDIVMTEAEMTQYGKRLWALQEKGFTIKVVER